VQDNNHHSRAFVPHRGRVQHPRAHNPSSRNAVQLASTSLVCVGSSRPSRSVHLAHLPIDLITFMTLDLAALIVQAIGGGKASIAAQNGRDPAPGGNIMMYGIIVQMVGMTLV
jgi:RTA1 like protein